MQHVLHKVKNILLIIQVPDIHFKNLNRGKLVQKGCFSFHSAVIIMSVKIAKWPYYSSNISNSLFQQLITEYNKMFKPQIRTNCWTCKTLFLFNQISIHQAYSKIQRIETSEVNKKVCLWKSKRSNILCFI